MVALLLGASGVAASATSSPSAHPTYYACLKSGKLTQVGSVKPTCRSGSSLISWNAAGPSGPSGPSGPTGTSGTNGVNGTNVMTSAAAPSGTCNSGDTTIELDNSEVWTCVSTAWVDSGSAIDGAQGPAGPAGPPGPAGQNGTNGTIILSGNGPPPTDNLGDVGDFYLDTSADVLYGPATCGGFVGCTADWGSGTSLIGPAGSAGDTILTGVGGPTSTEGTTGDFYLDTAAHVLYGPASHTCFVLQPCHTVWGTGTSLIGPQGPPGQGPAYDLTIPDSPVNGISLYCHCQVTIGSMPLPVGGDYTVSAAASLAIAYSDAEDGCFLVAANPGGPNVILDQRSVQGGNLVTMSLQGVVSIAAGGSVSVLCSDSDPNMGDTASNFHVTATQVSTFTETVG